MSSSRDWLNSGTAWRGEFSTQNTSEAPSDAVESSLLEVLETEVSPRYLLSPKACEGIMRRATRRGKTLPPALEKALLQGCEGSEITK